MRKQIALVIFCLAAMAAGAQSFDWAKSIGGTAPDKGTAIAIDNAGNIYSTGYFRYAADFDPGSDTLILTSGNYAAFVCKFDPSGNLIWAKEFQSGGGYDSYGTAISVDRNNNVITTGYFSGVVDFDPGTGSHYLTSNNDDAYITKLDSGGNFIWAMNFEGSGQELGFAVATDDNNNIYTAGEFAGTVDFNPGTDTFNLSSTTAADMYVNKLSPNGDFVWTKRIGAGGIGGLSYRFQNFCALTVDASANTFVTGHFTASADFDSHTLQAIGDWDIFICKLDTGGNFSWVKQIGGTVSEGGTGISVDNNGYLYTTGGFEGTVDFDPGAYTFNLTAPGTDADIYIAKYDVSGNFIWAKRIGDTGDDVGYGITTDNSGKIYTTGSFTGMVDFNPDTTKTFPFGIGGTDVFVVALSNSGDYISAYAFGNPGTDADEGLGIALDHDGNIYTTGYYNGIIDFDPGAGIFRDTSNGDSHIFIHKMNSILSAIPQIEGRASMAVYPNPVSAYLTVQVDDFNFDALYSITDITGRTVLNGTIKNKKSEIDLSSQPNGIYFLEFSDSLGRYSMKIVVQH